jgi:prepilin-type N-terminal cleavage/methylation domain-containing protein/prepilin-type processing-associated H-X9-DG protein
MSILAAHLRGCPRKGYTLIELLVVVSLIAVLIGLLFPAVQKVREAAAHAECTNNLKQLALACQHYEQAFGVLPPARVARDAYATWPILISPFIEQSNLFQQWDVHQGFSSQTFTARQTTVRLFFCPSRRKPMSSPAAQNVGPNGSLDGACGDYACCTGDGTDMNLCTAPGAMINGHVLNPPGPGPLGRIHGVDQPNTSPPRQPLVPVLSFTGYTTLMGIPDGASHTFLLGEKHVRFGHLGQASEGDQAYYSGWNFNAAERVAGPNYPIARDPFDNSVNHSDQFGSWHEGVCLFAFADGHVQGLSTSTDVINLGRLADRADGATITIDH